MEMSCTTSASEQSIDQRDFLARGRPLRTLDRRCSSRTTVAYFRLVEYLARYTQKPILLHSAFRASATYQRQHYRDLPGAHSKGRAVVPERREGLRLSA